jgi:HPt (histidine-containing phosphotransfer) domain-containing protein
MGLDQNALNELRALDPDGSEGLLAHIITSYLSDAEKLIQQTREAFAAKDVTTLTRNAHTLKSTSLTVGATRVADIAKEIEMAGKSGTLAVVPMFLTVLSAEYAAAEGLLQAECRAQQSPRAAQSAVDTFSGHTSLPSRAPSGFPAFAIHV